MADALRAMPRWLRRASCLVLCGASAVAAGCGARRITLPSDPGTPLPDFAGIHMQVSSACVGVKTFTAELGLSGRAGDQALRGRVVAGFARPSSLRLEGASPVPFGGPIFVLAARGDTAVLLLPRESRVVRSTSAGQILGALTGVTLAPPDLQAVLTGCVMPTPRPVAGRLHRGGWAAIDLDGGATVYLRRDGSRWRVRAARRSGWQIEYSAWPGAFPQALRLQSESPAPAVDLAATISQIEANVDLSPSAFEVDVPPDARPLTLDELRDAGPLRGQ
jgi:hypothetical protein